MTYTLACFHESFLHEQQLSAELKAKPVHKLMFHADDSGPVNTGAALWYVYNNIINKEGDRPDVTNFLMLDTAAVPDDDAITPARALRKAGVVVGVDLILLTNERPGKYKYKNAIIFSCKHLKNVSQT